ncbi:hypothetical protein BDQ12DRAFT_605068, partial [Crucibulum laeve]
IEDGASNDKLIREAFSVLDNNGVIKSADGHSCLECTQKYKSNPDAILTHNPTSVVGVDENEDNSNQEINAIDSMDMDIDNDYAPVKMVVLDGIVMGPTHCAFDNCFQELYNSCGGSFCEYHEANYESAC